MTDAPPAAPFDAWPVQHHVPGLGFFWYTKPAVFVSQARVQRGTAEVARAMLELIDVAMTHRAAEIQEHGGLLILHDWRTLTSYDRDARVIFTQRVRQRRPGEVRRSIVVLSTTHPVLRMAVQAVNLIAAVTSKSPIDVIESLDGVLEKHKIAAPAPGVPFPGGRRRSTTRPPSA